MALVEKLFDRWLLERFPDADLAPDEEDPVQALLLEGALDIDDAMAFRESKTHVCPACMSFFEVPAPLVEILDLDGITCECGGAPPVLAPGEEAQTLATVADGTNLGNQTSDTLFDGARLVAGHRVISTLGRGAMGEVLLVSTRGGERKALKLFKGERRDGKAMKRFVREASALAKLESRYIVPFLGRGEDESGTPYILMGYVPGGSLQDLLRQRSPKRLGIREALFVLLACARGLADCHKAGVLHRDVKPSNILTGLAGEVRLTDYGIALSDDVSARLTARDNLLGTPQYIAPEPLSGGEWSEASDVYSLGATAWHVITGDRPFPGDNVLEVISSHLSHTPPPLSTVRPDVPSGLSDLVEGMLALEPKERPTLEQIIEFLDGSELRADTAEIEGLWRSDLEAVIVNSGAGESLADLTLKPGVTFQGYEVRRILGRGGMGVVYEALHLKLRKTVALKTMLSGSLADEKERRRFLREAEAVAALDHPAIVPVIDAGDANGTLFLTMDYVEGTSLKEWAQGKSHEVLLRALQRVCEGLHHAHSRGVIHRDIKPDNVIVDTEGNPKVLDFGIAKTEAQDEELGTLTSDGTILGTLRYMSPEQASGQARLVDVRSDVYALGTVTYELLCGTTPFQGGVHQLLHQVIHEEPRAPSTFADTIPWELDAICLKALEKDPAHRYQSAQALAQDMELFLEGRPIAAKRATWGYRARKWVRRNRRKAIAITAACAAAMLLAAGITFRLHAQEQERQGKIFDNVARGWTNYDQRSFGLADKAFALAAQDMTESETLRLPEKLVAALPADVRAALPEPVLQRARLEQWSALALRRDQAHRLEVLIARTRAVVDDAQGDLSRAQTQLQLLETDAPGDPRVLKLKERLGARLLARGQVALKRERTLSEEGKPFVQREATLNRALEDLRAAQSLDAAEAVASLEQALQRRSELVGARERESARAIARTQLREARAQRQLAAKRSGAEARTELRGALAKLVVAFDRWPEIPEGRAEEMRVRLALGRLALEERRLGVARQELDQTVALSKLQSTRAHSQNVPTKELERLRHDLRAAQAEARGAAKQREEAEAASKRADVAFANRRYEEARAAYEVAATLYPPEDSAHREAASVSGRRAAVLARWQAARAAHDLDGQRGHLRAALRLDLDPKLRDELRAASVLVGAKLQERALDAASKLHRAASEQESGWAEVISAYERALSYAPDNLEGNEGRADAYAEQARPKDMVLISLPRRLIPRRLGLRGRGRTLRFYVDRHEVSNAAYAEFLSAPAAERERAWTLPAAERAGWVDTTGQPGPAGWSGGAPPAGEESFAVSGVSAAEAASYAAFRKRRLPTELEWRIAACLDPGGSVRKAPWAESRAPTPEALRLRRAVGTWSVDVSPWGVSDLGAGVSEWVSRGDQRVVRGLSHAFLSPDLRTGVLEWVKTPLPTLRHDSLGFRCALDVPEPPSLRPAPPAEDR